MVQPVCNEELSFVNNNNLMMMMMLMDEADTLQHRQNCTEQTGPVKQFK
jgi:hypothetical protein